jgi:hypothetical protein
VVGNAEGEVAALDGSADGHSHHHHSRAFKPARHLQAADVQGAQVESLDESRDARLGPGVVAGDQHVQRPAADSAATRKDVAEQGVALAARARA